MGDVGDVGDVGDAEERPEQLTRQKLKARLADIGAGRQDDGEGEGRKRIEMIQKFIKSPARACSNGALTSPRRKRISLLSASLFLLPTQLYGHQTTPCPSIETFCFCSLGGFVVNSCCWCPFFRPDAAIRVPTPDSRVPNPGWGGGSFLPGKKIGFFYNLVTLRLRSATFFRWETKSFCRHPSKT